MSKFISTRPDKRHMHALLRCKSEENSALLELFRMKLEESSDVLLKATEPSDIYRLQGRVAVLKDFLESVEAAQGVLERL